VRFVITAGPTREPIDPVRYLSNRSSGKMGYALAGAALDAGHEVILISGPVCLPPPGGAQLLAVTTSDEMHQAVHGQLPNCDILVMCAAVADYKPAVVAPRKIKKHPGVLALELIPTRDILASLATTEQKSLVVGFAAETNDLEENAQKKLREKNCDIIVANDVGGSDSGMESDENEVTIFFRNDETKKIWRTSKKNMARELVKIFSKTRENSLTKNM
jgi:phosphopantothenoylcysteine decarboxylase / phosphopantothenate---cysteine ligase